MNQTAQKPEARVFWCEHPHDGTFIGVKEGESGYYKTTIYDLGHCSVMNARQGNTAAEVEAAAMCSMGTWHQFDHLVELCRNTRPVFQAGMKVDVFNAKSGLTGRWPVAEVNDGLVIVKDYHENLVGIFSYLNGKGLNDSASMTIKPVGE